MSRLCSCLIFIYRKIKKLLIHCIKYYKILVLYFVINILQLVVRFCFSCCLVLSYLCAIIQQYQIILSDNSNKSESFCSIFIKHALKKYFLNFSFCVLKEKLLFRRFSIVLNVNIRYLYLWFNAYLILSFSTTPRKGSISPIVNFKSCSRLPTRFCICFHTASLHYWLLVCRMLEIFS